MKNNTKVRLHLSKKLFESLTKEIIKEAKANDGYTVAVKQPKTPKQSKSQATSPEVQKTDAEAMMGEAGAPPVPPLPGQKPKMPPVPGNKPSAPAAGMSDKSKDATREAFFQVIASTASLRKNGILDDNDISKLEDLANKAMDGLKEGTGKMDKMEEMEMNVAEEGQVNELADAVSWEGIAAGMAAIGLAPLAIEKMHQWWKKKHPESFKKAQALSGAIDRQAGGNAPGQSHGVDPKKTFGPQNEKNNIKEYEQHYRMVNGECRRYNDEGEYTVVSSHYCR
jgi:hypothetical protein